MRTDEIRLRPSKISLIATINFQTALIVVNDDSLREVRNLMSFKLGSPDYSGKKLNIFILVNFGAIPKRWKIIAELSWGPF